MRLFGREAGLSCGRAASTTLKEVWNLGGLWFRKTRAFFEWPAGGQTRIERAVVQELVTEGRGVLARAPVAGGVGTPQMVLTSGVRRGRQALPDSTKATRSVVASPVYPRGCSVGGATV